MKAKVKVKVFTEEGYWCLKEIKGLEEGTILSGTYKPKNNSISFIYKGERVVLFINQNAELLEIIEESQIGRIVVSVGVCHGRNIITEKNTIKEARKFVHENKLKDIEYWYLASEIVNEKGDINIPCWGKTRNEAIAKLRKLM